ncbi:uncharacterized protein MONOS_5638 [Monocercomonoides exilis]|uniref:uncharacterized protein n=1 Tax=Monocercomonoides exilis TaxID=2049356 RepID=UPI00355ABEB4|nr:hypothetical protein MONOS_5638 [Monocercomonoides exilis]|eukprot:MONOS_5638.1-p1 / transcript=MONOS_5638.1 / gene=MONOS_5638 / organism=Monocercomonoides_exilis_PA203 / gene_product=unspecified product / transcript_product=unspecified product / location=Mono_scaffold00166:73490-74662(-) / protein_length=391 / sequence_SO=supercontig / SO=protein_coding / is_pseudo=false
MLFIALMVVAGWQRVICAGTSSLNSDRKGAERQNARQSNSDRDKFVLELSTPGISEIGYPSLKYTQFTKYPTENPWTKESSSSKSFSVISYDRLRKLQISHKFSYTATYTCNLVGQLDRGNIRLYTLGAHARDKSMDTFPSLPGILSCVPEMRSGPDAGYVPIGCNSSDQPYEYGYDIISDGPLFTGIVGVDCVDADASVPESCPSCKRYAPGMGKGYATIKSHEDLRKLLVTFGPVSVEGDAAFYGSDWSNFITSWDDSKVYKSDIYSRGNMLYVLGWGVEGDERYYLVLSEYQCINEPAAASSSSSSSATKRQLGSIRGIDYNENMNCVFKIEESTLMRFKERSEYTATLVDLRYASGAFGWRPLWSKAGGRLFVALVSVLTLAMQFL